MSVPGLSRFRKAWIVVLLGLAACAHQDARRVAPGPQDETIPVIIHTLPVGAGNCQLLQCPTQNRLIVFDCGSGGKGLGGWDKSVVKAYIDRLIDADTNVVVSLSHGNDDHSDYLPTVFAHRTVQWILQGGDPASYPASVRSWIKTQSTHGAFVQNWWPHQYTSTAMPESDLSCWGNDPGGGVSLEARGYILAVNAGLGENSNSMVVASEYGDFLALFTGDMTGETEEVVEDSPPVHLANTRLLTAAHHGATTDGSNSSSWAMTTRPQIAVFSAGTKFNHPRCQAVDRYIDDTSEGEKEHSFSCGNAGGGRETRTTQRATYTTGSNGLIIVKGYTPGNSDILFGQDALAYAHFDPSMHGDSFLESVPRECTKARGDCPP